MLFEAEKEALITKAFIPSRSAEALLSLMTFIDTTTTSSTALGSSIGVIPTQMSEGLAIHLKLLSLSLQLNPRP